MKKNNSITFFDFADLNYSSFFLNGFLENSRSFDYEFSISKSYPGMLSKFANDRAIRHIPTFQAHINGETFIFCIDTADSCGRHPDILPSFHKGLLESAQWYFKVNYNKTMLANDSSLGAGAEKILPTPAFLPLKYPKPWQLLPSLNLSNPVHKIVSPARRVKTLLTLRSLQQLKRLRDTPKDIDIFFVVGYYGRPVHAAEDEFRYQIMHEIASHKEIVAVTGFASHVALPGKFAEFKCKRYLHPEYLHQLSRAKIAIYVRGVHDCLSFKFGQIMALGMPVVGQTLHNNAENMYQYPYFKDQFAYNTPQLIAQKAVDLLKNPEKLALFGKANAHTFDTALTPRAITARILERLGFPRAHPNG